MTEPPLGKTLAVTSDPPFESKVTALSNASQRAYIVIAAVTPGAYGKVTVLPPSVADQPANV